MRLQGPLRRCATGLAGLCLATSAHATLTWLTPEENRWLAAHPVVTIAPDPDGKPFDYLERGRHKGLAAGFMAAIAELTGLRYRILATHSEAQSRAALVDGRADLLPVTATFYQPTDSASRIAVSTPYYTAQSVLVSAGDEPVLNGLKSLDGKTLAVREGSLYERFLSERYPGIALFRAQTFDATLQAVLARKAVAAIGPEGALEPLIRRRYPRVLGIAAMLDQVPTALSVGVRADEPLLLSIVDKTLARLSATQTDQIVDYWLAEPDYGAPSWRAVVRYYAAQLGLALAVLGLILWFARRARIAQHAAVQSEKAKSKFIAAISHEIRTPMNAVLASVELLELTTLDDAQRRLAQTASAAASTLLMLLNDVLDWSRLDAHRLFLDPQATDLEALSAQTIDIVRGAATEKGLALQVTMTNPGGTRVCLDPIRVRQIMLNLLSNAIKFTGQGSVALDVRVFPDPVDARRATVRLAVRDTGIGIEPAAQARLFQPFIQADNSTTRQYGGTGLGLTICRELVRLMHGEISLTSAPGEGTVVTVRLNVELAPADAQAGLALSSGHVSAAVPATFDARVLVVEDHPANRLMLDAQLRQLGCTPVLAPDGDAALAASAAGDFDLILMDCRLPGMDGFDVTRHIRAREAAGSSRTPIVAISAETGAESIERCLACGMDDVLPKPVGLAGLRAQLTRWAGPAKTRRSEPDGAATTRPAVPDHAQTDISSVVGKQPPTASDSARSEASGPVPQPPPSVAAHAVPVEVMEMFRSVSLEDVAQLRVALAGEQFGEMLLLAHRIKGAAYTIGAHAAAAAALDLEQGLAQGRLSAGADTSVRAQLDRLAQAIGDTGGEA